MSKRASFACEAVVFVVLILVLACNSDTLRPGESPADYAVRLAADHDHVTVAQLLSDLPASEDGASPLDEGELVGRGYYLLLEGKIEEAYVIQQVAVELFPSYARAWANLGEVAIYLGDREAARQALEQAIELDPDSDAQWLIADLDRRIREAAAETDEMAWFAPGEQTNINAPYLGQTPPGVVPEIFAPGIVSTRGGHEFSITFSPDGTEIYFNRGPNIFAAYLTESGWTAPAPAPFNSDRLDHEPFIPSDGARLFFGSARPRSGVEGDSYGIWVMDRTNDGWSPPEFLFPGMFVTISERGDAYVTEMSPGVYDGICVYRLTDGDYGPCERLDGPVNNLPSAHPLVAPDESFLIFDSEDRLLVSLPTEDQGWAHPTPLEEINAVGSIMTAALSPDGEYLFFYANHDIYWVSTRVLDPYLSPKSH